MSEGGRPEGALSLPARQRAGRRRRLDAALLGSVAEKARRSRETNARFFAEQGPVLVAAARALAEVYRRGGRLFSMGNGGSSCDAAHVAVEFLHPVTAGRPALEAVNLAADTAMLLAVGNDVGFEHVFVRQIIAQGARRRRPDRVFHQRQFRKPDRRLRQGAGDGPDDARAGRRGRRPDDASGLVDHCLVVPTASIHRIQECHVAAYHILWDLMHTLLADDRGSATTKGAAA